MVCKLDPGLKAPTGFIQKFNLNEERISFKLNLTFRGLRPPTTWEQGEKKAGERSAQQHKQRHGAKKSCLSCKRTNLKTRNSLRWGRCKLASTPA